MIRIKVYKLSQIIKAAVIGLLVIAAVIVGIILAAGGRKEAADLPAGLEASVQFDASVFADKSHMTAVQQSERLLQAQLPLIPDAVPVTAEADQGDLPDDPDRIHVQIAKIKGEYKPEPHADKPRILIYHTHTYEAYAQDPDNPYKETTQWRTQDENHNITAVGAQLKKELEALGMEVVHDKTEHEPPKLGTAYVRSLATLQAYADADECFDLMIDLHRDAASARNTNPSTVDVDGKSCARLMMLIGTGEGSEGNRFSVVPNWEENYKLAQALTDALNAQASSLCRDVMVKTGRYNQHMSESAVLIEVGHNENTLKEAMNAAKPLANAIASVLMGDD